MRSKTLLFILMSMMAATAFAQPHQVGDEGGGGCATGTMLVIPAFVSPGACGGEGDRTIYLSITPPGTLRFEWPHNPLPIPCAGEDVWVDVHLDRFNVEGPYWVSGLITYNPALLDFYDYNWTADFSTSSNVFNLGNGVLQLDYYANPPLRGPSNARTIAGRIAFHRKATNAFLDASGVRVYSNDPILPFHEIPPSTFCRYGATISYVQN